MITPIIMESDIEVVKEKVGMLRRQQEKRVHFDIGDGLFSELFTIAPADLQALDLGQMRIDFHLLVDDPAEWIEECVALGPKRIIGQIEHMGSKELFVETVAGYGGEAGLALKMETPIEAVGKDMLTRVKTILLLEIPPGTTGSPFDMRVLDKIRELRGKFGGNILVDGGVNPETYKLAIEAGANEAGANSTWWGGAWQNK
ncbi:MAG: hypothetical protein ACD_40C00229G0005 [uncultured bacterium]|nr:MAG: hypothetical protein ACD_40C00229G0005 [uncultured bacterium]